MAPESLPQARVWCRGALGAGWLTVGLLFAPKATDIYNAASPSNQESMLGPFTFLTLPLAFFPLLPAFKGSWD